MVLYTMSVRENSSLPSLKRDSTRGWLNEEAETKVTETAVKSMKIKTPNNEQMARFLSDRNQQKIVLGKWLAMKPKLLMLDEPTRGIDIRSKKGDLQTYGEVGWGGNGHSFCIE